MREMITYPGKRAKFNFRVAGVAFDPSGERVLIHRGPNDPFWTLPGGRVELMESAADALKREMQEELSVEVMIERLLWVVENFFEYNSSPWHEIAFYFVFTFPPACPLYAHHGPFVGYEEGVNLIYLWHDLATISQVNILPSFLRTSLTSLPPSVEHIVHIDE
jgi:ADP-ribose pyrophosphatase YjhB (NUDIX family)